MGKTIKILTIADSSCASGKHCAMVQVTALAGLLYGAWSRITQTWFRSLRSTRRSLV